MAIGRAVSGIAAAGLGLVGLGYAGLAGEDNSTRDDSGQIVDGGEVGAFRIRIGDCFVSDLGVGDVESVQGVPCSEPHDGEAYFAFNLPDGDFPGEDFVGESADQGCYDEFEGFVGEPYETSVLGYWTLTPTEASWDQLNDREILCVATNYDGTKKTGSAKNAGI